MTIASTEQYTSTNFAYNFYCNSVGEQYKARIENNANKTVYFHMKYSEQGVQRFLWTWILYPIGKMTLNTTVGTKFEISSYVTATAWFVCTKVGNITL